MIRFTGKWVRSRDREPMTAICITHYLTREDLAHQLIAAREPHSRGDLAELSRAEIEKRIRGQLKFSANAASWWADDYNEDEYGEREVSAEEALEWARGQVAKL